MISREPKEETETMTEKQVIENAHGIPEKEYAYTDEDMRRDADYYLAEHLTKMLLDNGSITVEEYEKILREHARNFGPTLAPLMP